MIGLLVKAVVVEEEEDAETKRKGIKYDTYFTSQWVAVLLLHMNVNVSNGTS